MKYILLTLAALLFTACAGPEPKKTNPNYIECNQILEETYASASYKARQDSEAKAIAAGVALGLVSFGLLTGVGMVAVRYNDKYLEDNMMRYHYLNCGGNLMHALNKRK
jgi:hypothetical protein